MSTARSERMFRFVRRLYANHHVVDVTHGQRHRLSDTEARRTTGLAKFSVSNCVPDHSSGRSNLSGEVSWNHPEPKARSNEQSEPQCERRAFPERMQARGVCLYIPLVRYCPTGPIISPMTGPFPFGTILATGDWQAEPTHRNNKG